MPIELNGKGLRVLRRSGARGAVFAAVGLTGTAVAVAAVAGPYKGKTSQNQPVSFTLSSSTVSKFRIVINDRCPGGHVVHLHQRYPSMAVKNAKFGGKFVPVKGHRGEKATLEGMLGHGKVTGTLKDVGYSTVVHKLCHGSARFTAHGA